MYRCREAVHLLTRIAGVCTSLLKNGLELGRAEAQTRICRETGEKVICAHLACAHVTSYRHSEFLDRLVRALASSTGFHRFHENGGSEQEGKIALEFLGDDGLEDFHLIQHGEEGFQQAIHGQEGIREHHAAHDGAGDVAFVPLVTRETARHGKVALEHHM